MKIAIIGRTRMLLDTAKLMYEKGFSIQYIYTCKGEDYYNCNEDDFRDFSNKIKVPFLKNIKINSSEQIKLLKKFE